MIKITVLGEPIAKGRPKVTIKGGFPTIYTPKETRAAELAFQKQALPFKPSSPLEGALRVSIRFYKKKPKSYAKSVVHWTKKPDIDNMIKLVLDSMNKIFFKDDAQVVELHCKKEYSDSPRTEVLIETV